MDPETVGQAQRLAETASRKGLKVSAAESCTGGLIGATITSMPGASSFFLGSVVTYSNEAKENLLKVPRGILFAYGAVSQQTASLMAKGAVRAYGSDIAVAVTGIAGPGGATADKPVGLVYVAVSDGDKTQTFKFNFEGDRDSVRSQTVFNAIKALADFAEAM